MKWEKVGNISGKDGEPGKDAAELDIDALATEVAKRIPPANVAPRKPASYTFQIHRDGNGMIAQVVAIPTV